MKKCFLLRISVAILALLTALSALVACNGNKGNQTDTTTDTDSAEEVTTVEEVTTIDPSTVSGVPEDLQFSDKIVYVMTRSGNYVDEFDPDEGSQDLISTAVVSRN